MAQDSPSHGTGLAVKYQPGDQVLVYKVTGGITESPFRASVIGPVAHSSLYNYRLECDRTVFNVKDEWICPADVVIEEVCDTPWE